MIWQHYIGGKYDPDTFMSEAMQQGVSRRVAWQQAKQLSFGDRVMLGYWDHGKPYLFAEFTIRHIHLQANVATPLIVGLAQDSLLPDYYSGEPLGVTRECGSYDVGAVATLSPDMDISEIVERAIAIAEILGVDPWFMVGGPLTVIYDEEVWLPESSKFFRGFKALKEEEENGTESNLLIAVQNYERK